MPDRAAPLDPPSPDPVRTASRRRLLRLAAAGGAAGTLAARPADAAAAEHRPGVPPGHVRRIADRAMDGFDTGWRTGDWQPFLAILTDEFSFWFPEDPARGRFEGAEGRRMVEEWALFHGRMGNRVRGKRLRADTVGNRVFYAYESHGTSPSTAAYRNWELIIVEVRGERISALHEYWGNARPAEAGA